MSKIILNFIFNGKEIKIQCKRNEFMKDIFKRYISKIDKDIDKLYFIYNGGKINEELKLKEINNKENNIIILVYELSKDCKKEIIFSKDIICPKCGTNCIININDYKIDLNNCENSHIVSNILFKEFNDSQIIDKSKIICNDCKKNIFEIYNNQFYKCCKCNINLCPLCKLNHNQNHLIIDYNLKDYICYIHGEKYISYCNEYKKNLCDLCGLEHDNNHTFLYHREIIKIKKII